MTVMQDKVTVQEDVFLKVIQLYNKSSSYRELWS